MQPQTTKAPLICLLRTVKAILGRFVEARCFELLDASEYADKARALILSDARFASSSFDGSTPNRLAWVALICGTHQYGLIFEHSGGISLRNLLEGRSGRGKFPPRSATAESLRLSELPDDERSAVSSYLAFIDSSPEILATSLVPWSELVTALRQAWRDSPAFDRIALLSAGIRSKLDLGTDGDLSPTDNIVSSARFARLKSGAPQWWRERLGQNMDSDTKVRWLLLFWLWATPRTLVKLAATLDQLLTALSSQDWTHLSREFYILTQFVRKAEDVSTIAGYELSQLESASSRLHSFIGQRLPPKQQLKFAMIVADDPSAEAPEIQFALEAVVRCCLANEARWSDALESIKALYLAGGFIPLSLRRNFEVPIEVAEKVSREPDRFPLPLVASADSTLRGDTGSKAARLQVIAARGFNRLSAAISFSQPASMTVTAKPSSKAAWRQPSDDLQPDVSRLFLLLICPGVTLRCAPLRVERDR